eukprot:GAHX01003149.1.p1 GENE.GAHX01003149.1~~GAHX01003149.1.p1  ORF type:complete len:63 (+),score=1.54 GAHX01003149.1:739-927(+)
MKYLHAVCLKHHYLFYMLLSNKQLRTFNETFMRGKWQIYITKSIQYMYTTQEFVLKRIYICS